MTEFFIKNIKSEYHSQMYSKHNAVLSSSTVQTSPTASWKHLRRSIMRRWSKMTGTSSGARNSLLTNCTSAGCSPTSVSTTSATTSNSVGKTCWSATSRSIRRPYSARARLLKVRAITSTPRLLFSPPSTCSSQTSSRRARPTMRKRTPGS